MLSALRATAGVLPAWLQAYMQAGPGGRPSPPGGEKLVTWVPSSVANALKLPDGEGWYDDRGHMAGARMLLHVSTWPRSHPRMHIASFAGAKLVKCTLSQPILWQETHSSSNLVSMQRAWQRGWGCHLTAHVSHMLAAGFERLLASTTLGLSVAAC